MIINLNIGLLGHVDSGKTSLAKILSSVSSTAAFDKNPQSKERGITLDLGFSALQIEAPAHIKRAAPFIKQLQITFVDCPGHASLIRTIIGGAQIIDLMILVIDAQKGIQTQTAECIVIGEILQRKLVVVVNKVDLLAEQKATVLKKLETKLRKTLVNSFGDRFPFFAVSALSGEGISELLDGIKSSTFLPEREIGKPFLMNVDHCFSIKGQGTIVTGTVMQGCINVNHTIEIPSIKEHRKIKSIQMFRQPVEAAKMGDRVGVCVTQFNAKLIERGVICEPGYLKPIYAAVIQLQQIKYYKYAIKSKTKFHVSIGHETVMAHLTLFKDCDMNKKFDPFKAYEYIEHLEPNTKHENDGVVWVLLEFEKAILTAFDSVLIASKLDLDVNTNCCRLAFWGRIQWHSTSMNYASEQLKLWKIYKNKQKQGTIQRLVSPLELIVQNLFRKESNRQIYVGKQVELSTGEIGRIESTFGQTSKVKVTFSDPLKDTTLALIKTGRPGEVSVILNFKKYIFNKDLGVIQ